MSEQEDPWVAKGLGITLIDMVEDDWVIMHVNSSMWILKASGDFLQASMWILGQARSFLYSCGRVTLLLRHV